jgi:hypothetical protein
LRLLRFGITTLDGLRRLQDNPDRKSAQIAFTLLASLQRSDVLRFEPSLAAIYEQLPGGTQSKRTFARRYGAIDSELASAIEETFRDQRPVRVHDMAASNAITSVELFDALKQRPGLTVRATDYFDRLTIVSLPGSHWRVVFDAEGRALQFIGQRMVLSAVRRERRHLFLNRFLRQLLQPRLVPRARQILAAGDPDRIEVISLFHPIAIERARQEPRFTLGSDNLFDPEPGTYEVIRIMSAFAGYPEDQVTAAVGRIASRLCAGGLLTIGRQNRATGSSPTTIFSQEGDRLLPLREIDGGFELSHAVKKARVERL